VPHNEWTSMKAIALGSFFVLFAIIGGLTVPTAFADHSKVSVSVPAGTNVLGCEVTDECFIPATVTVDAGGEVTWSNDDSAAHTVTSGTAAAGPDQVFDSGLFLAKTTFSWKATEPGEYPYFCMVHPWMVGTVIVEGEGTSMPPEKTPKEVMINGMTKDGSVKVEIKTGTPTANEMLSIEVKFMDAKSGSMKEHANYDITATQKGKEVLSKMGAHEHGASGKHQTSALGSADPVDVKITLNGFGLPGEQAKWTGPKGEVVTFNVVPEFGTIAVLILVVAIVSIIAVTARSKLSLTPRI
jgi:predicted secreted protein with PEFG-CTERM motif